MRARLVVESKAATTGDVKIYRGSQAYLSTGNARKTGSRHGSALEYVKRLVLPAPARRAS
jgi:hypothetical protein